MFINGVAYTSFVLVLPGFSVRAMLASVNELEVIFLSPVE